ncbi:spore germination protein [Tuberibacillus calidus]|jgi:hypothetical protein|uniref:spore germination protein n=1 Tax=Tuberibacillus calidus TaxID=340097 RepID=UPI0003FC3C1A|nr:spore germination protein [Tuberibacillus calidus]
MPSIAGAIKVNQVQNAGVFTVGDTLNISPKNVSKNYAGSGSINTGDLMQVNSGLSSTNTYDGDLMDADQFLNN